MARRRHEDIQRRLEELGARLLLQLPDGEILRLGKPPERARVRFRKAESLSALARGVAPAFAADSTEAAIYRATADLLEHKRVSADNYAAAVAAIGTRPIV